MNDCSHVHERPWLRPLVVICSDMQQSIDMSCVFLLCLGSKWHCRSPAFPYQEQYIPLGLGQPIHNTSPHLIQPLFSCHQSIPVPFVLPQISISPTPYISDSRNGVGGGRAIFTDGRAMGLVKRDIGGST